MAHIYDWSKERAFRVDEDNCLLWRGCVHSDGNPTLYVRLPDGGRKYVSIKRAVLSMILQRPLARTERAVSMCGKERCCSPYCVRAISYAELNRRTAAETGYAQNYTRRVKISASMQKRWRWTIEQIADMRARDAAGEDRRTIAAEYGSTVDRLRRIFHYQAQVLHLDPSLVAQVSK